MNKVLNFIKRFISTDAYVSLLKNDLAKLAIEYHKSRVIIKDAEKAFKDVKDQTVNDFAALRKNTLNRTQAAVLTIKQEAVDEFDSIQAKYFDAKDKVEKKIEAVNDLHEVVLSLGSKEFPLE